MRLSVRQRCFADEFVLSGNIVRSALAAGYSEKFSKSRAYSLLDYPAVRSYIDNRMTELSKKKVASQEEVLQVLSSVLRQEITEDVVSLSPVTGEFVFCVKKPSVSEVIRAASELLKRYPVRSGDAKAEEKIAELFSRVLGGVDEA